MSPSCSSNSNAAMSPKTQLNMSTTYHVYSCGHTEVDSKVTNGLDGPQFVFTEGPCSGSEECAITDPTWFGEQYVTPGPAALSTIAALADQLQDIRIVVKANLDKFDEMTWIPTRDVVALADVDVVDLLLNDDRNELVEGLFHFSLTMTMLRKMRYFAKRSTHRPFFDFCRREARSYIENAKSNVDKLHSTVTALKRRDVWKPTISYCHWPDSRVNYEPDFGIEELDLLRSAGGTGLKLLSRPFDLGALHEAEILVECMKQKLATTAANAPPSGDPHLDEFEAWLQQELLAFLSQDC